MDWLYLFYFLLGGAVFFGARACRKGEWNEGFTSLGQTKTLQGIAALGVMLHHMAQKSCAPWHPRAFIVHGLDFFVPIGYLFVSIFLFCSGLGLYKSWKTKPEYLRGFCRRRILPLAVAYYLSEIIYLLVRLAVGEKMNAVTVLWYLSGLHMANFNSWYLIVIPFFYLAFWLAFRFCRRDGAAIAWVFAFTLAYTALGAAVNHQNNWWMRGEWWYNSILLFPLGLLAGKYEARLTERLKKGYWLRLVLSFAAVFALYWLAESVLVPAWGYYGENWGDRLTFWHRMGSAASQWLACIACVGFCFLLMMKVRLGNRLLTLLGAYTLELYLMHGIFVELFGYNFQDVARSAYYIKNVPLYILAVLACSVPGTALFHLLWKAVMRGLNRSLPGGGKAGRRKPARTEKEPADPKRQLMTRVAALTLAMLLFGGGLALSQRRGEKGRVINGMLLTFPKDYACAYADARYAVWKPGAAAGSVAAVVLDGNIRNLNADFFYSADQVLTSADWLNKGELYVNPEGVRMARGFVKAADGAVERRYYVESASTVFLISMIEDERYADPATCEETISTIADSVRRR